MGRRALRSLWFFPAHTLYLPGCEVASQDPSVHAANPIYTHQLPSAVCLAHCSYPSQEATWRLDQSVRDTTAQRQSEAITKLTSYSDPNAPSEKLIRCIIGETASRQCDVIMCSMA